LSGSLGGAVASLAGRAEAGMAAGPEARRMEVWLARWLAAFNAADLHAYRTFVEETAPSVLPYVDDDLSVREITGGFDLVEVERLEAGVVTARVRDRAWDRVSRVTLSASDDRRLEDIAFAGAPALETISRLKADAAVAAIGDKIAREGRAGRFSGAVLVAQGDQVAVRAGAGVADEASGARIAPGTRFCIGSMGKMFTAVAVMQMVEAGRIRLETPIRNYLPDYPNAALAEGVTVRHLLTHTGGTGDVFGPGYDGHEGASAEPGDLVRLYGAREPLFAPGSRWAYSNFGFVLLGRILEVVRDRPYGALVEEQVFGPCGMGATSLRFADSRSTATAYSGARATGLKPLAPYVGLPAGGGYSTVDDLGGFAVALRQGRLVRPDTLKAMTERLVAAGASHWGLGFALRERNGLAYFGHGGSAPGVGGDLAIFPAFTTIVLCNRGHPSAVCLADFMGARLPQA
jgi:D-alanyl-D-alanine carboxypeptidase